MHEAREQAAQVAWKYCLAHPVLDLQVVRELVRLVEPILAAGWYEAQARHAIQHPDIWPDPVGDTPLSAESPTLREIELPDPPAV